VRGSASPVGDEAVEGVFAGLEVECDDLGGAALEDARRRFAAGRRERTAPPSVSDSRNRLASAIVAPFLSCPRRRRWCGSRPAFSNVTSLRPEVRPSAVYPWSVADTAASVSGSAPSSSPLISILCRSEGCGWPSVLALKT
jgi:hypothetical protein